MQINLSQKKLHFRSPMPTLHGILSEHPYIGIMITDDKGSRIGLGECAPIDHVSVDADHYRMMSDVARLINESLNSDDYTESLRKHPALLFAVESALADYQQNELLYGTPFAQSLHGIPLCATVCMRSFDDTLQQVKKCLLQGYRSIRLDIMDNNWSEQLRTIEKVRSRFSASTLEIRINANGLFTPAEAMDRINQLAVFHIHSIEQPIARYQWKEMAQLCAGSPIPIVLSDELTGILSLAEKQTLLDTIRPQYIAISPTLHGGLSGSMEWANEANKRGIPSWLCSAMEGNIGLRNIALLSARIYGADNRTAQCLDSGLLYTDNIEMDMEFRSGKLWRCEIDM